jgi:uncharacterized membrane protein
MKPILPIIFGVILSVSTIAHLVVPDVFNPLIPEFIPSLFANILAAIVEGALAVMLFLPKYRHLGGLGFSLLMVAFLPLHIWELFKEEPLVGPEPLTSIRVVMQFVLIYLGWRIYRKARVAD